MHGICSVSYTHLDVYKRQEREKADQSKMAQIKREVREKSLEKQVEIYQNELKRLLEENERLKKENLKLAKKLEKMSKNRGLTERMDS